MTEKFSSDTDPECAHSSGESTGEHQPPQHANDRRGEARESPRDDGANCFNAGILGELAESLEYKRKEADECRNAMMRALADLENYKKRSRRERAEMRNDTIAEIVEALLPILDNFEFGLAAAEHHGAKDIVDGFAMIFTNFKGLLSSYGLREIFPLNEKFDMHLHECVHRVIDNEMEIDTVVAVNRRGYKLNDKLLRPAIVAVSYREEQPPASE
jgi:molecular chaperone GrpE